MNEPLEFRIVQDLQAALRSISIANGYHHDISSFAVKLDADADVESLIGDQETYSRPFVLLELLPDKYEYVEMPDQILLTVPFIIHAVHNTDPTLDESKDQTYYRLCADVEKAIVVDISRDRLAQDTRIASREMHLWHGQQVWAMLTGLIRERRTYGEPNG